MGCGRLEISGIRYPADAIETRRGSREGEERREEKEKRCCPCTV
jgi:hypothetical protein